jgi:hypothetical protein
VLAGDDHASTTDGSTSVRRRDADMTSVTAIFKAAELTAGSPVPWGSPVQVRLPGVYAIATTDDAELEVGLADCPLDESAVRELLRARPEALVDGVAADTSTLTERLRAMWVPREPVVYIGLAGTSVATRVGQFYKTRIGARAPHAGGWPVKMLDVGRLWVHPARCEDPDAAERAMAEAFEQRLSHEAIARLIDPACRVPFANLMYPGGRRKQHGLTGVKAARLPTAPRHPGADLDDRQTSLI